ncbi:MAG: hypothetical protein D6696_02155 [Acidobacteria bacterium]|nr:MAG: hypothetical protein D6696_02155 [Acidobacteriota bacterium]
MSARPTIKPLPDGPYLVKGLDHLSNRKGTIPCRDAVALCRCGGSAKKPFCDGTHARIGFSSAKLPDRVPDRRQSYAGRRITIHDNRGICAHAGHCTDGLPAVFRLRQEPWIDPDGATPEEIAATIRQCPSGALSYSIDGVERRDPEEPRPPAIFVAPNGPYAVTGGPELADCEFGDGASREHYTLCRCGGSKNKPFCDGSHWHNGFRDDDN